MVVRLALQNRPRAVHLFQQHETRDLVVHHEGAEFEFPVRSGDHGLAVPKGTADDKGNRVVCVPRVRD